MHHIYIQLAFMDKKRKLNMRASERQHHTGNLKSLRLLKGGKSLAPKKKEWPLVFVTQELREGELSLLRERERYYTKLLLWMPSTP